MTKIELNVKAQEDELYLNHLNLYEEGENVYNYGLAGLSHVRFGNIVARLDKILETMTEKELIDKCRMNCCTVRIGGLDFKL